jgi:hypothetical protein
MRRHQIIDIMCASWDLVLFIGQTQPLTLNILFTIIICRTSGKHFLIYSVHAFHKSNSLQILEKLVDCLLSMLQSTRNMSKEAHFCKNNQIQITCWIFPLSMATVKYYLISYYYFLVASVSILVLISTGILSSLFPT